MAFFLISAIQADRQIIAVVSLRLNIYRYRKTVGTIE